jgi:hypothetical protein
MKRHLFQELLASNQQFDYVIRGLEDRGAVPLKKGFGNCDCVLTVPGRQERMSQVPHTRGRVARTSRASRCS